MIGVRFSPAGMAGVPADPVPECWVEDDGHSHAPCRMHGGVHCARCGTPWRCQWAPPDTDPDPSTPQ